MRRDHFTVWFAASPSQSDVCLTGLTFGDDPFISRPGVRFRSARASDGYFGMTLVLRR
jgi:hypothetical protein